MRLYTYKHYTASIAEQSLVIQRDDSSQDNIISKNLMKIFHNDGIQRSRFQLKDCLVQEDVECILKQVSMIKRL